jgi:hypothetical protein
VRALSRLSISLFIVALCASCATTQSRFSPLGGATYPPRTTDVEIAMFAEGLPSQPFKRIARLDVHLEKTAFVVSSLKDATPELKKQARLAGGDAIIEIREQRSSVGETRIYHVTATAVRYVEGQAAK